MDIQPRHNDKNVHSVSVVTARIMRFHVHEAVLTDDSRALPDQSKPVVDWRKLLPVGRLGGDSYTLIDNCVDIERPKDSVLYGPAKQES